MPDIQHRPKIYAQHHYWATCACGWQSAAYTSPTDAHLAFGEHLAPRGSDD